MGQDSEHSGPFYGRNEVVSPYLMLLFPKLLPGEQFELQIERYRKADVYWILQPMMHNVFPLYEVYQSEKDEFYHDGPVEYLRTHFESPDDYVEILIDTQMNWIKCGTTDPAIIEKWWILAQRLGTNMFGKDAFDKAMEEQNEERTILRSRVTRALVFNMEDGSLVYTPQPKVR